MSVIGGYRQYQRAFISLRLPVSPQRPSAKCRAHPATERVGPLRECDDELSHVLVEVAYGSHIEAAHGRVFRTDISGRSNSASEDSAYAVRTAFSDVVSKAITSALRPLYCFFQALSPADISTSVPRPRRPACRTDLVHLSLPEGPETHDREPQHAPELRLLSAPFR